MPTSPPSEVPFSELLIVLLFNTLIPEPLPPAPAMSPAMLMAWPLLSLMPVLVILYGPREAVPIMAVAALLANASRALVWWREVDRVLLGLVRSACWRSVTL